MPIIVLPIIHVLSLEQHTYNLYAHKIIVKLWHIARTCGSRSKWTLVDRNGHCYYQEFIILWTLVTTILGVQFKYLNKQTTCIIRWCELYTGSLWKNYINYSVFVWFLWSVVCIDDKLTMAIFIVSCTNKNFLPAFPLSCRTT